MKQPDICPRHGGAWGGDETCMLCTTEHAEPRDVSNYTRHTITIDIIVEDDEDDPVPPERLAIMYDLGDLLSEHEYLEIVGLHIKKEN